MKTVALVAGACYGMLSVILGAFGAHAFKSILSVERLQSFETGVRYQMYAALYLLVVGFFLKFDTGIEKSVAWMMILGTLLFSGSIYLLSFQEVWGANLKFLGPITPLGGLFMILSWAMLLITVLKIKN
ncbi:DUF423 domain-containing protein [Elizabethkingia sp. JS20170427COW]|uniref:DUF423 domain-containing protein n=1 Tax=Elizabethkingia sp. JS20170427COW TaxID=2583851 RepID=UPI001110A23D|nr:DUF423 domain-containing protein [Elizabethkingia sp. JS20170427COW]QCX54304.1 DUF423 domain-containing protein [Elizabethkingia sp. JS20170427COW]